MTPPTVPLLGFEVMVTVRIPAFPGFQNAIPSPLTRVRLDFPFPSFQEMETDIEFPEKTNLGERVVKFMERESIGFDALAHAKSPPFI